MSNDEKITLPDGTAIDVSDYDPDRGDELRYTRDGRPITNELIDQWQREIENDDTLLERATNVTYPRRGRPSLTSPGIQSPQIRFRVSANVRSRADKIAAREGTTVSQLARELLERYLRERTA